MTVADRPNAIAAMAAVVVLSNVLVQHPVALALGSLNLADLLTWGAFSYPLAFLVTDSTNRLFGPRAAANLAVYTHDHDHHHDLSGNVVALPSADAGASSAKTSSERPPRRPRP